MKRTHEQRQAAFRLNAILDEARLELHVRLDTEGWPIVTGKYGVLEWLGAEADGSERLYVFCDSRNIVPRLRAVRGLHRCQIGDTEARFWLSADDAATLRVVVKLIRAHRRRIGASPETLRQARLIAANALIGATARRQNAGMSA